MISLISICGRISRRAIILPRPSPSRRSSGRGIQAAPSRSCAGALSLNGRAESICSVSAQNRSPTPGLKRRRKSQPSKARLSAVAVSFLRMAITNGRRKLAASNPMRCSGLTAGSSPLQGSGRQPPTRKAGRWIRRQSLTTASGPDLRKLHIREPVVIPPEHFSFWLEADERDACQLNALLINRSWRRPGAFMQWRKPSILRIRMVRRWSSRWRLKSIFDSLKSNCVSTAHRLSQSAAFVFLLV